MTHLAEHPAQVQRPDRAQRPGPPAPAGVDLDVRPVLRPDLQISDRVWHGRRAVHLIRDPRTDTSLEIGVREHYLLTHLNGVQSLAAIGRDYRRDLGCTIDARGWRQLLALAGSRGLLVRPGRHAADTPEQGGPGNEGDPADKTVGRWQGSILRGEVALVRDGQRLTDGLLRGPLAPLRRLPGRAALVALIGLLAAMLGLLAADLPALVDALVAAAGAPLVLVATILVLWLSGALHEIGHGVVARAYGGRVREIGVSWRLPVLIPFCRVEDYRYLPSTSARLATAGVGCLVNLTLLVPFAIAWFAPTWAGAELGADLRSFLAAVLICGVVLGLVNLVPLAPLDGYVLLGHATRTLGLAAASQTYASLAIAARLGGSRAATQREEVHRYPRHLRRLYAGYAVAAPLTVLACATASVLVLAAVIPDAAGPWRWAGPIAVAVLVIAGLATTQRSKQ